MQAGVSLSQDDDLKTAVGQAVAGALRACPSPRLVVVLATFSHGADAFKAEIPSLKDLVPPNVVRAGGMVNGLALGRARYDAMFNHKAVAALAIGGDDVRVGVAIEGDPRPDPVGCGRRVTKAVAASLGTTPRHGIIFTPGIGVGVPLVDQDILTGANSEAPGIRLAGTGLTSGMLENGLSAPALGFMDDRIEEHCVLLVAFDDSVAGAYAMANGAEDTGQRVKVTQSDGHVWTRSGGLSAEEASLNITAGENPITRQHFSKNPAIAAVENQITVAEEDPLSPGTFWCQTPAYFGPEGAAVGFFPVKEGIEIASVRIDAERALQAVTSVADKLKARSPRAEPFALSISFSCCMRGFTLGARGAEEDELFRERVPSDQHLAIVANGEVGCGDGGDLRSAIWTYSSCGILTSR